MTESIRRTRLSVIAGIVATLIYFGAAELIARSLDVASAPALVIGQALIPLMPTVLIKSAIAVFGTHDKLALVITIVAGGAGLGAIIGWIGAQRRGLALVLLIGFGLLPAVVGLSSGAGLVATLPSLGGIAVGAAVFLVLLHLADAPGPGTDTQDQSPAQPGRRAFFGLAAGLSVVGIAAVAAGQSAATLARSAAGTVTKLVLPRPAASAPEIPTGAELDVPGLTPLVTETSDFYRIDTALFPPSIDAGTWMLRVHGMVEHEFTITMAELLDLPLQEHYVSLACVSNEVGGDLVGNAKWLGYPIRDLLARAKPLSGADMVLSGSDDGFTASTPLEVLTDDRAALLAVAMNGHALPRDHGYPARLVVPGLYGYVSATKWVTDIEVTKFADKEAYWTTRGWSTHGPVLVASRIDVPRPGATVSPKSGDRVVTAGMAWAQHTGIEKVQVRIDNGDWAEAELSEELTADTWRQWRCEHTGLSTGTHTVSVRAIDQEGNVQTSERRPAIPGAATGLHERQFTVE
ncbi:DMSO/TMAO reductase YedYZ, molybdopterin-dependent catalytic subunit [Brevibacterium siliguriense]|uniref:DMSO/TMAO reductase YedYZ, molybdopterin-dependent catalytic subunit n=1 Tax=Brevibacterium siliguriense TaxID=1136497 RepID=A0A1H1W7D7_9MICO|nr:molybdopterin-dependent oxidoreductase [Brevibacterium siliguriense]SDS92975.1 DMSO/TMAO reductase YedYZ, molybdopterin-dependent catalytic subunit [Brevibacterium siliguriense]